MTKAVGLADVWRSPSLWLATLGGWGLSPYMPGTVGSLVTLPVAAALVSVSTPVMLGLMVALLVLGSWAAAEAGCTLGKTDHGAIVVDELLGQLLTLWIALWLLSGTTLDIQTLFLGFVCFRLYDIAKPWPVGWCDRQFKNGFGVMLDDIIAALWAGMVLVGLLLLLRS